MSWQDELLSRFFERDAQEKSLVELIENHRKLSQHTLTFRERNKTLLKATTTVKQQDANGPSIVTSSEDNPVRVAYVKSLEEQIATLRDELAMVYKTQSQNAQRLVVLTDTLREGEERARAEAEQYLALKSEKERLTRRVEESQETKRDKEKAIEHLNDELRTLQLEYTQLETRNSDLQTDNKSLLTRWIDHMNAAASQMNDANAKAETSVKLRPSDSPSGGPRSPAPPSASRSSTPKATASPKP